MKTTYTPFCCTLFLLANLFSMSAWGLSAEQRQEYLQVRQRYFVAASVLPGEDGRARPEHLQYLRGVTAFMNTLDAEEQPLYMAAGHFYRGRLLLRIRDYRRAEQDLQACLQLIGDRTEDELPSGLPVSTTIRIYHALSGLHTNIETVLTRLEAIPEDATKPNTSDVGETLRQLAQQLERREQHHQALRCYKIIQKFGLWEEERHNPSRRIDLINLRLSGGMMP